MRLVTSQHGAGLVSSALDKPSLPVGEGFSLDQSPDTE